MQLPVHEAPLPMLIEEEPETIEAAIARLTAHPLLKEEEAAFRREGIPLPNVYKTENPEIMFALIDALCSEKRRAFEIDYNARLRQTQEYSSSHEQGGKATLTMPIHMEMTSR